jgi:GntR family transcriptional regulator, transcriptional repressor for pyruvate dehydrogenase complex
MARLAIPDVRPPERIYSHVFVAEQLRRQIALRLLAPGDALPTQRELAAMFGVGRATADRAVRLLENEGLVVSRRGRAGGRFVTRPAGGRDGLQSLLDDVRVRRDVISEALVFRRAVEPTAAARAAVEGRRPDLDRLQATAAAAEAAVNDAELARLDSEFHLAVAAASHNRLLVEATERVRLELVPALLVLPDTAAWHARTVREHRRIVTAIGEHDAEGARRAMDRHLRGTEQSIVALLAVL